MILFVLKTLLYFTISFSILCIPIGKKPLFNILYSQFGEDVLETMQKVAQKGQDEILPRVVSIITSEPKPPKKRYEGHFFSAKKYTPEEKNLMQKVLNE
jgi:hypothetical protein